MTQQPLSSSRRLSILRHAKAEEGHGDDTVRALNSRGVRDAKAMGLFLKQAQALPELILCSTATRTRQTLTALDVTIPTQLSKQAYLATPGELMQLIHEADDAVRHILLIGHNPGLHSLVVGLAGSYASKDDEELLALKFPSCALASLAFDATRWRDIAPGKGRLDRLTIGSKL